MGERVETGRLVYSVLEAEWHTQLGDGMSRNVPEHRFLLVRLSVTNNGAEEIPIPALYVLDARGNMHPELTSGEGVPQWLGIWRSLKPAETRHGRVVFDVARGDYRLRVADESMDSDVQHAALIDIPLRFETGVSLSGQPR
jgi:hypothetical protein